MKEVLSWGLTVAKLASQSDNLASGEVFSFLPADTDLAAINNFAYGGVMEYERASEHLVEFLRNLNNEYPSSLILFENRYAKVGDACLARCLSQIVTLGIEVYHVAYANDSGDVLLTALKESATAIQTSIMIFEMTGEDARFFLSDGSLRNVAHLVLHCNAIAVSAFDGEGYIIWSKQTTRSQAG